MTLGERLRSLREKAKLSQLELSRRLNMPNQNISNYERDFRTPDLETLQKLADFFDVTTDYLIGRTNNQTHPEEKERQLTLDFIGDLLKKHNLNMVIEGFDLENFEKLSPEEQQAILKMSNDNIQTFLKLREQRNKK